MMAFDVLYPEVARRDVLVVEVGTTKGRVAATILFREFYCNDPGCDCRRVVLHAAVAGHDKIVAGIGYGFEPSTGRFADEPQVTLDPLNPQSELSLAVLDVFAKLVEREPSVRRRFIEHYVTWKNVVDDPKHPDHAKVRSTEHDDLGFTPAYKPRHEGYPPNRRCYCRSGKKFKNCCARSAVAGEQVNARS